MGSKSGFYLNCNHDQRVQNSGERKGEDVDDYEEDQNCCSYGRRLLQPCFKQEVGFASWGARVAEIHRLSILFRRFSAVCELNKPLSFFVLFQLTCVKEVALSIKTLVSPGIFHFLFKLCYPAWDLHFY